MELINLTRRKSKITKFTKENAVRNDVEGIT
jgi:hypothetical protein